jgi:ABC-type Fe3+/spermidine/putrescine transport system ATPase subunit
MLELRALGKRFGDQLAVRDASLSIPDGEFFSLLGPSGCGKTTLLRMISGLELPSSGEIHYSGSRIDQLPPNERQFNMVFQRYALFPHLTVEENVAFGLKMKKVLPGEIRSRVKEVLALVQMSGFETRRIATLSGGQSQRVALARALVNRPRVLLLDEPLSALDLKLRQQMQVELLALQRRLGHTFIFVTHDQEEALTLSDRIAVMSEGRVEQLGSPREIYDRPATPFVAGFIGTMNSLPGPGGTRLLVRPEKVRLSLAEPSGAAHRFSGTVREVLFQGAMSQFLIDAGSVTLTVSRPSSELSPELREGSSVWASFAAEDSLKSQDGRVL